jgi:hypothetical protein
MSALEKILAATNASHPQPPPIALVLALDAQRRANDEKRRGEGKPALAAMYDLSGNIIEIDYSNGR